MVLVALSAACGTLNVTTAAAGNTVAVAGLGFQPSCVIFFYGGRTTAGAARGTYMRGFGVAVSTSARWAVSSTSLDAQTTATTGTAHAADACIISLDSTPAQTGAMDLQSFDAGGFTLVIDDAFPSDFLVHYLALGGSSLTGAACGVFTPTGTAPVTQQVTGLGITPTCVLFAGARIAANPPNVSSDSSIALGAMSAAGQGVWAGASNSGATNMATGGYGFGSECHGAHNASTSSLENRAEFSALASGSFTINWLERSNAARVFYLALAGVSIKIGSLTTATSLTTVAVTSFGFTPAAVLVVSANRAASTQDTISADDKLSIGVATSPTSRCSTALLDDDGAADSVVFVSAATDSVYQHVSTTAVVAKMDVQTFDNDGITFVMDLEEPVAGSFAYYVALGPAAAVGRTTKNTRSAPLGMEVGMNWRGGLS